MNKEYAKAAASSVVINPMRLPNTLHLALGVASIVMGGVLLLGITNADTVRSMGVGALGRLSTGMLMLLLGGVHISLAMRYFRFTLNQGDAGEIAVPLGTSDRNTHLFNVINKGVVNHERPSDPLLSVLYGLVPHLSHAPATLRRHAEMQLQRVVYLAALMGSFGLAWVFAQPVAFAWMAAFYFILAIIVLKPLTTLAAIRRGVMESAASAALPPPRWRAVVGLVLLSIAGPLAITLSPLQVPAPPFATATVALPTLAVLGGALIASALFTVALIAQTQQYASSGARCVRREDMELHDLTDGLIEHWYSRLPYPRKDYLKNHSVTHSKHEGLLLCETEPVARADQTASTLRAAFESAWNSPVQRPLLGLGLFGSLLGLSGLVFAFVYTRSSGHAMMGLIALGFISASQFAMASAHELWNRVDFTSTLYYMRYVGNFESQGRTLGTHKDSDARLSDRALKFLTLKVEVCVAQLESTAFRDGLRHITAIDLLPDASMQQFGQMEDYVKGVGERSKAFDEEQRQIRHALASERIQPPALPQPAGRLTDGMTEAP